MSEWKQQIEAQIATIDRFPKYLPSGLHTSEITALLRPLLDVAADKYIWSLKHGKTTEAMNCYCDGLNAALDKLQQVARAVNAGGQV